ncbi:MAG: hypothetical protein ACTHN5_18960 [Phycisphaerae bacterium]
MPAIGRNTKTSQIGTLSNEDIQKKWDALLPNFVRYAMIAGAVAIGTFLVNHFMTLPQRATDVAVVVFEIACIFAVCFVCLALAALFFRSDAWIGK